MTGASGCFCCPNFQFRTHKDCYTCSIGAHQIDNAFFSPMRVFLCILLSLTVVACRNTPSDDAPAQLQPVQLATNEPPNTTPTLTFAWETDSLLTTIESVLYDPASGYIYTANIEGDFMEKDGQGSISRVSLEGDIVAVDWVASLDAPTGLTIHNGTLYATDIDRIIAIDIETATVSHVYPVDGAVALNDITVAPDGAVYASDTSGNTIYKLEHGEVTPWLEDIDTPNGLLYHNEALLVAQWTPETLYRIDVATRERTHLASGLPQADGVDVFGDNSYLVSSWGGRVFYVGPEGEVMTLLDTSAEAKNAADANVVVDHNLLLVATFLKNSVTAYEISF